MQSVIFVATWGFDAGAGQPPRGVGGRTQSGAVRGRLGRRPDGVSQPAWLSRHLARGPGRAPAGVASAPGRARRWKTVDEGLDFLSPYVHCVLLGVVGTFRSFWRAARRDLAAALLRDPVL